MLKEQLTRRLTELREAEAAVESMRSQVESHLRDVELAEDALARRQAEQ